ncbi:hypothetical protein ACHAWC_000398 [Mediolabrus comicus]
MLDYSINVKEVLQILVSRDWKTLSAMILTKPALFRHVACAVSSCSEFNGMTLLHAVVRCNPPLDIVAQIIHLCPDMLSTKDCLHRTPLHVAAGSSNTSASLLKLLAHACPAACEVQDVEGKTPLHFACDSSCVLFQEDHDRNNTSQSPNHEAIATLLSYSIHATTLEDDEAMSPLEHAIMSDASIETVKLLQSATRVATKMKEGLQDVNAATANRCMKHSMHSCLSTSPTKKTRRITLDDDDIFD